MKDDDGDRPTGRTSPAGLAGALLALALLLGIIGGGRAWGRALERSGREWETCTGAPLSMSPCLERDAWSASFPWFMASLVAAAAAGFGLALGHRDRRRRWLTGAVVLAGCSAMGTALALWMLAPPLRSAYVLLAAAGWLVVVGGAGTTMARGNGIVAVAFVMLLGGPVALAAVVLAALTP